MGLFDTYRRRERAIRPSYDEMLMTGQCTDAALAPVPFQFVPQVQIT
jgi:hypothetical protein